MDQRKEAPDVDGASEVEGRGHGASDVGRVIRSMETAGGGSLGGVGRHLAQLLLQVGDETAGQVGAQRVPPPQPHFLNGLHEFR